MKHVSFNLLTSAGGKGCIWLILLFFFTFILVHLTKLVRLGWEHTLTKPKPTTEQKQEKPKPQEKAPAKPQEPIYYVIERKRKKPKTAYTEPRQITFK
ncbi:MAG: hypothetical protein IJF64_04190 [Clostridia bacterium]|nr:hypothetical protein [Clostridia bacterium]